MSRIYVTLAAALAASIASSFATGAELTQPKAVPPSSPASVLPDYASIIGPAAAKAAEIAAPGGAPAAVNKFTGEEIRNGSVLLTWTSDGCSTPGCNPTTSQDFLAVIDAEPNSLTFGNVIWTAELPSVPGSNILPGGTANADSHNDPHHMLSYTSYISGGGDGLTKGHKYQFAGGVISKNVFRYDITSVRSIGVADIAVCGLQPRRSSLTDDFVVMPAPGGNHKILYTYMGNFGYGPAGSVTEIEPGRNAPLVAGACLASAPSPQAVTDNTTSQTGCAGALNGADDDANLGHIGITEYQACVAANQPRNPTNYTSSPDIRDSRKGNQGVFFLGNQDAGLEAQPHGMGLTYDGKYLVSSDYAVPASIGAAAVNGAFIGLCNQSNNPTGTLPLGACGSTFGASVRVFETSNSYTKDKTRDSLKPANVYANNPYVRSVSAVPDGPRQESVLFHEENEGLMAFGLPHQSHHCKNQAGWINQGDPSYDKAITPAGVAANASGGSVEDCTEGDANYVPHDGAFTAAMCGGVLFYSPDITIRGDQTNVLGGKGPYWRPVYDVGPCTGVSYFSLTDDDRFLVQPISGIESPAEIDPNGAVEFDRDYPREHSRRVLLIDVRPLFAKGRAETAATAIQCDYHGYDSNAPSKSKLGQPASRADLSGGLSGKFNILKHNNEADDCPRVRGAIGQFETGPLGIGAPTTLSSNSTQLGVSYTRTAQLIQDVTTGNLGGVVVSAENNGGEPSGSGGSPGSGNLNTLQNMYTHGGPHFTVIDRVGYQVSPTGEGGYKDLRPLVLKNGDAVPRDVVVGGKPASGTERYAFIQYFVELNHIPGPGTGSDGDRTICMAKVDRTTGATELDTAFTDELLGTPCIDFDSAARDAWVWPGARGVKGTAKPHSAIFERDGAALFGPGYLPEAPVRACGR